MDNSGFLDNHVGLESENSFRQILTGILRLAAGAKGNGRLADRKLPELTTLHRPQNRIVRTETGLNSLHTQLCFRTYVREGYQNETCIQYRSLADALKNADRADVVRRGGADMFAKDRLDKSSVQNPPNTADKMPYT
ncbi:hypothetical protein [Ruegeria sp.]|uniref:hypothetical protein n=1 Tax=Ruegeria sp. TaxID=1879320 RepID=UPI003B001259